MTMFSTQKVKATWSGFFLCLSLTAIYQSCYKVVLNGTWAIEQDNAPQSSLSGNSDSFSFKVYLDYNHYCLGSCHYHHTTI